MGETYARSETAIDGCDVGIGFVVRTVWKTFPSKQHGYCSISTGHCLGIEAANFPRSSAGNAV